MQILLRFFVTERSKLQVEFATRVLFLVDDEEKVFFAVLGGKKRDEKFPRSQFSHSTHLWAYWYLIRLFSFNTHVNTLEFSNNLLVPRDVWAHLEHVKKVYTVFLCIECESRASEKKLSNINWGRGRCDNVCVFSIPRLCAQTLDNFSKRFFPNMKMTPVWGSEKRFALWDITNTFSVGGWSNDTFVQLPAAH